MQFQLAHAVTIVFSSLVAAGLLLIFLDVRHQGRIRAAADVQKAGDPSVVFLFDGDKLVDASDGGRALLSLGADGAGPWERLLAFVAPRFPEFLESLRRLPDRGHVSIASHDKPPLSLRMERNQGVVRITLLDAHAAARRAALDPVSQRALEDEVAQLRETLDHGPILVWAEDGDGSVIWANRPYLDKVAQLHGKEETGVWPFPRLFTTLDTRNAGDGAPQRLSLNRPGTASHDWFECHLQPSRIGRLVYAVPADQLVRAEHSLRGFMQTLTKTFAQLSVGLAVFDNDHRLALFNPALIDLTTLAAEFLSARPTVTRFIDALREKQMIPEPKDYKAWRTRLEMMDQVADSGQYEETWALASGRTYRVTGRPHADGGVAFLFEDISHEMSRTRQFRAELELGQSVIDAMDQAIAVFSGSGQMVLSNDAYRVLWDSGDDVCPTASGIAEAVSLWQSNCAPSPIWERAEPFVAALGPRAPWALDARLKDGRALQCRFAPLAGGATMVTFSQAAEGGGATAGQVAVATRQERACGPGQGR